jgi:hypothetical protein
MQYLLVQPKYYSQYPPLGLLKISSYLKSQGHTVEYIKGTQKPRRMPNKIYVTSLFTYAWEIVHKTIRYYKDLFPKVEVTLGGLYASLMPNHAKKSLADTIYIGLHEDSEGLMPDYSLVPHWDGSIIFSSRGCIRKCGHCAVPVLEPRFIYKSSISKYIFKKHTRVIFWDNNILANPFIHDIFNELIHLHLDIDFNQGLDARLMTKEIAEALRKLHIKYVRMAYDSLNYRDDVKNAIDILIKEGYRGRDLFFYTLYNYKDTPEDFLSRLQDLMQWGVVSYPMRFIPLNALKKNSHIAKNWTAKELEMIANARRVMGIRGAFPPYHALKLKILYAMDFHEAFTLRPIHHTRSTRGKNRTITEYIHTY